MYDGSLSSGLLLKIQESDVNYTVFGYTSSYSNSEEDVPQGCDLIAALGRSARSIRVLPIIFRIAKGLIVGYCGVSKLVNDSKESIHATQY